MKKKKQHFVPRFYLKYFSINGLGKQIGIYNKIIEKFIPLGGLKNQAYEDYFYGKDGTAEDNLSVIEQQASKYLSELIVSKKKPTNKSDNYQYIKEYTFLQDARTKASSDEMNDMINKSIRNMMKHDDSVKKHADKLVFKWENAVMQNIQILMKGMYIINDLGGKLLINETDIPFVTSDNPVVKYNQFLESKNHYGGKTGLASKGLQIFFPINSNLMMIYYDTNVYKVGNKKQNEIILKNREDIKSLNLIQFLNCDENIYFNENFKEQDIKDLCVKSNKYKDKERLILKEYPPKKKPDGTYSIMVQNFKENIDCKLELSFIKELKRAKKYKLSGWASELRKEEWRFNGFLKK